MSRVSLIHRSYFFLQHTKNCVDIVHLTMFAFTKNWNFYFRNGNPFPLNNFSDRSCSNIHLAQFHSAQLNSIWLWIQCWLHSKLNENAWNEKKPQRISSWNDYKSINLSHEAIFENPSFHQQIPTKFIWNESSSPNKTS